MTSPHPIPDAPRDPAPASKPKRRNKREELLRKAAELIARQGFDGTSMRDIAAAVDILPGSLYYHFASKEEMLTAIHARVVEEMTAKVQGAIAPAQTPWDRLEAAATAHLEGLLETGHLVTIISPNFSEGREDLNATLKAHRDEYETMFKGFFDELDLPDGVNRALLRLQLLGALNWVPVWYDPKGRTTPRQIAQTFVASIRQGAGG